jgi:hypothetical protein
VLWRPQKHSARDVIMGKQLTAVPTTLLPPAYSTPEPYPVCTKRGGGGIMPVMCLLGRQHVGGQHVEETSQTRSRRPQKALQDTATLGHIPAVCSLQSTASHHKHCTKKCGIHCTGHRRGWPATHMHTRQGPILPKGGSVVVPQAYCPCSAGVLPAVPPMVLPMVLLARSPIIR